MKSSLYNSFKIFIKIAFFFYCKKINTLGKENVPDKGAVLFLANHPNGLIDPILIASQIRRKTHFLVKADIFKNPKIATFFSWLGMMPVFRIRDGIKSLAKNNLIFEKCGTLLKSDKTLLIFPEGTHDKKRTIRPINKGFTRIVFRTLADDPTLKIHIIPVGITYQNSSKYPTEVTVNFGKSILASSYYDKNEIPKSAKILKDEVAQRLKALTVHINNDENYNSIVHQLDEAQVNYTDVEKTNEIIKSKIALQEQKKVKSKFPWLKWLIIINSFVPYLVWKKIDAKITEIEFKDTFRLGINTLTFPAFYLFIAMLLGLLLHWKIAVCYLVCSFLMIFIHTKISKS